MENPKVMIWRGDCKLSNRTLIFKCSPRHSSICGVNAIRKGRWESSFSYAYLLGKASQYLGENALRLATNTCNYGNCEHHQAIE